MSKKIGTFSPKGSVKKLDAKGLRRHLGKRSSSDVSKKEIKAIAERLGLSYTKKEVRFAKAILRYLRDQEAD